MANILKDAKILPLGKPTAGVELALRQSDERALLFVINHTGNEQTVAVPAAKQDLLSGNQTGETIELAAFDVAVIELPAADARRDE